MILTGRKTNHTVLAIRTQVRAGTTREQCNDILSHCQNDICGMITNNPTQFSRCAMICSDAYRRCMAEATS